MIKFFRKIRQKMLTESKFSKYLLYAIGEIVLVVIGILIALQINNWNENKKLEELKQVYYQQLLKDLNKDKEYLKIEDNSNKIILSIEYASFLKIYNEKTNIKQFKTILTNIDTIIELINSDL
jgi:sensor domain CHASE-containing protein